jgi:hypothetical protein
MTKKTKPRITKAQQKVIRSGIRKGHSGNRIQKTLSRKGMGIRRQVLLRHIRRVRRIPIRKVERRRYVPIAERRVGRRKYAPYPKIPTKQITLFGRRKRRKGEHLEEYLKTAEVHKKFSGSGKELYNFVKHEMEKYNEGEFWDSKPTVRS